ncbi:hypothetical protein C8Q80DRAFT_1122873 [Daedaleopsis nitida]|nr:hypothetical protein C8Q80DRAFT_1122873 [Daedaleopsis nitida]
MNAVSTLCPPPVPVRVFAKCSSWACVYLQSLPSARKSESGCCTFASPNGWIVRHRLAMSSTQYGCTCVEDVVVAVKATQFVRCKVIPTVISASQAFRVARSIPALSLRPQGTQRDSTRVCDYPQFFKVAVRCGNYPSDSDSLHAKSHASHARCTHEIATLFRVRNVIAGMATLHNSAQCTHAPRQGSHQGPISSYFWTSRKNSGSIPRFPWPASVDPTRVSTESNAHIARPSLCHPVYPTFDAARTLAVHALAVLTGSLCPHLQASADSAASPSRTDQPHDQEHERPEDQLMPRVWTSVEDDDRNLGEEGQKRVTEMMDRRAFSCPMRGAVLPGWPLLLACT